MIIIVIKYFLSTLNRHNFPASPSLVEISDTVISFGARNEVKKSSHPVTGSLSLFLPGKIKKKRKNVMIELAATPCE